MTDAHIRILQFVARHRQRELSAHDADANGETTSGTRRRHLVRAVTRTDAHLTQAEARRRHRPATRPSVAPLDSAEVPVASRECLV
jgi:hypothetical protein